MAQVGTKKELSVRHENHVASAYGGRRSPSSGGSPVDKGDVKVIDDNTLFECKAKFGMLVGSTPVKSTLVKQMEKIADEAWESLKEPALALRFYCPESYLADWNGWVDLVVRRLSDDVERSRRLQEGPVEADK